MSKIKIKRGLKSNLPVLEVGEPGFATDTSELYIGNNAGNVAIGGTSEEWVKNYVEAALNGEDEDMINGQSVSVLGWANVKNTIPCDGRVLKKSDYIDSSGQKLSDIVGKHVNVVEWFKSANIEILPTSVGNYSQTPILLKHSNAPINLTTPNTVRISMLLNSGLHYQEADNVPWKTSFGNGSNTSPLFQNSAMMFEPVSNDNYCLYLTNNGNTLLVSSSAASENDPNGGLVTITLPYSSTSYFSSNITSYAMAGNWGCITNNKFYTIVSLRDNTDNNVLAIASYNLSNCTWEIGAKLPGSIQNPAYGVEGINVAKGGNYIVLKPKESQAATKIYFYNINNNSWESGTIPDSPLYNNNSGGTGTYNYISGMITPNETFPDNSILVYGYKTPVSGNNVGIILQISPGTSNTVLQSLAVASRAVSIRDMKYSSVHGYILMTYDTSGLYTVSYITDLVAGTPTAIVSKASGTYSGTVFGIGSHLKVCRNQSYVLYRLCCNNNYPDTYNVFGVIDASKNVHAFTSNDVRNASDDDMSAGPNLVNYFATLGNEDYYLVVANTANGGTNNGRGMVYYIKVTDIDASPASNFSSFLKHFLPFAGNDNSYGQYGPSVGIHGGKTYFHNGQSIVEWTKSASPILRFASINTNNVDFAQTENAEIMVLSTGNGNLANAIIYSKDYGKTWKTVDTSTIGNTNMGIIQLFNPVRNTSNAGPATLYTDIKNTILFAKGSGSGKIFFATTTDMTNFVFHRANIYTEDKMDVTAGVVGLTNDPESKKVYIILSSGSLYVASYTSDNPIATELDFHKDLTTSSIPYYYPAHYNAYTMYQNGLEFIKLSDGTKRLYAWSYFQTGTLYYKNIADTKWKNLQIGQVPDYTAGTAVAFNVVPTGNLFEICGAVAWCNITANIIVHDDINERLNISYTRNHYNGGIGILQPDISGKWIFLSDYGKLYTMNSEPYNKDTDFQMPNKKDMSIYWKN